MVRLGIAVNSVYRNISIVLLFFSTVIEKNEAPTNQSFLKKYLHSEDNQQHAARIIIIAVEPDHPLFHRSSFADIISSIYFIFSINTPTFAFHTEFLHTL